ncbi:anthranilate synthase component I family protein [Pontibacter sp. CAU 1760]
MYQSTLKASDLPLSLEEFRLKALAWADQFDLAAYYTPNGIPYPHDGFRHLLAVAPATNAVPLDTNHTFDSLREELQQKHPMLCGFLTYDLKNQIENLRSQNPDYVAFPPAGFFIPDIILYFNHNSIGVTSSAPDIDALLQDIFATAIPKPVFPARADVRSRVTKTDYLANVERIRAHILEGNVYELNYCMEFYAEQVNLAPLPLYLALMEASPTPFSSYLKYQDKYLLCASPERYLKKDQKQLITQPIKGTIRRGVTPDEDAQLQHQLRHSEKELAENMMIVDLARNDLSHSCATGTVQVEEMFGIYGFRQVSQMISTVVGELRPEKDLVDALRGTFPMGSMTGAPKISAMQLIDALESTKRGLYAGTMGYITADGNCDFNVVIRSMQYNAQTSYLSFMVGSAITYDSDPEQEYAECLLKAQAILKVLGHDDRCAFWCE